MTVWFTTILGVAFLGLAIAATYLMFKLWGYPFDKEKGKSEAPKWQMNLHRAIGYAYVIIYVIMMVKMVPRLWQYQIEFPPRTVAHIMLGLTIGIILVIKISILRWYRHFEEWMPTLGVSLLICTVLLCALSIPNVLKERALATSGPGGSAFSVENRTRVARLLGTIEIGEGETAKSLASEKWLVAGREVLLDECVFCHDLRTAIARPRSPADWQRLVARMQNKPSLGPVIDDREALAVTAYLVAITPELQRSAKDKRAVSLTKTKTEQMLKDANKDDGAPSVDLAAAKEIFEEECSLCHDLSDATDSPPTTIAELDGIIARMIENGMEVDEPVLKQIREYMRLTFLKGAKDPDEGADKNGTKEDATE